MNSTTIKFLMLLKNSVFFGKREVVIFTTPLIVSMLRLLYKEGVVLGYKKLSINRYTVFLRVYVDDFNIKIYSKPSRLVVLTHLEICLLVEKKFLIVLSTPQGLLTGSGCKKNSVGGVLLFGF